MASDYLKNWRKVNSMVKKLAEDDSEEEFVDDMSYVDDDEFDAVDDGRDRERYSVEGPDTEDEVMEEAPVIADDVDDNRLDLCSDLADWAVTNNQSHKSLNDLLQVLRNHGHNDLPKDSRTLLCTPKVVERQARCNGEYIYYGLETGIRRTLLQCPASPDHIAVTINVDGVPLFRSSAAQFWPMLAKVEGFEPFIVCLFSGMAKPEPLEDYVQDLVEEIKRLRENGIQHNGNVIQFQIKAFICDAPARAFLKNIIYHTGYYSCERCEEEGEWLGKIVFNSKDTSPSRTDEKFSQVAYRAKHQNGETPLIRAGIPCVGSFVLDYMHLVCLGVVRRILHYLCRIPNPRRLSPRQRAELSSELVKLRNSMPSEMARKPRSLQELDRWKATEFRQFLLYTGPVILHIYDHFLCLTIGMSILLSADRERRNHFLPYAADLLNHFVINSAEVYGNKFTVYNVHNIKHLHEDVAHFDCSFNEISAFPFENHLKTIKKLVKTSHNPLVQVAKRMAEKERAQKNTKQKQTRLQVVSGKAEGQLLFAPRWQRSFCN
ncbi:uncharacterized protein LOC143726066 [Siphateles boraxobius]|uniref:uncharacterized protein LOC143726066 n=1 Tax=Siphateles boraxobius TaxID=180520 RepID=UPI0040633599